MGIALLVLLLVGAAANSSSQIHRLTIRQGSSGPVILHAFKQFPAVHCPSKPTFRKGLSQTAGEHPSSFNLLQPVKFLPAMMGLGFQGPQQCPACGNPVCEEGYPLTGCKQSATVQFVGACRSCGDYSCMVIPGCSCCVACAYSDPNYCLGCYRDGGCS